MYAFRDHVDWYMNMRLPFDIYSRKILLWIKR